MKANGEVDLPSKINLNFFKAREIEQFQLIDSIATLLPKVLYQHEFHENYHSVTFCFMKKDSKRCCDTTKPESIHTKDESKRGSAFAFIFGVN